MVVVVGTGARWLGACAKKSALHQTSLTTCQVCGRDASQQAASKRACWTNAWSCVLRVSCGLKGHTCMRQAPLAGVYCWRTAPFSASVQQHPGGGAGRAACHLQSCGRLP